MLKVRVFTASSGKYGKTGSLSSTTFESRRKTKRVPVRKATGRELVPILATAATLPIFPTGSKVYAKYPETDTFYNAEVRTFTKGMYTLMFEGEDDNKEQAVDKRYVLDSRLK